MLLILAVVAIGTVQNDGIIIHAKNAREEYGAAGVNENATIQSYLDKIQEHVATGTGSGVASGTGNAGTSEKTEMITFTVNGSTRNVEKGMTWEEWANSSYGPGWIEIRTLKGVSYNVIYWYPGDNDNCVIYNGEYVNAAEEIEDGIIYEIGNVYNHGNGNKITFTINGKSYEGEEEMQWGAWLESDYNTLGEEWIVLNESGSYLFKPNGSDCLRLDGSNISAHDTIVDEGIYTST